METSQRRMTESRAGLTLLEVIIASTIMSVLVLMVYLILHRSTDTYGNESLRLSLDQRSRDVLAEIARDLREAGSTTLTTGDPPTSVVEGTSYNDLRFGVNSGYDLANRKVLFTRIVRYRWRMDPDEAANGKDDNANGLIDEGYIEKRDRYGVVTRICDDVKYRGLTFIAGPGLVTVTLELERRDPKGTLVTRKAVTAIELRN